MLCIDTAATVKPVTGLLEWYCTGRLRAAHRYFTRTVRGAVSVRLTMRPGGRGRRIDESLGHPGPFYSLLLSLEARRRLKWIVSLVVELIRLSVQCTTAAQRLLINFARIYPWL